MIHEFSSHRIHCNHTHIVHIKKHVTDHRQMNDNNHDRDQTGSFSTEEGGLLTL